jgi:hypothetical protein
MRRATRGGVMTGEQVHEAAEAYAREHFGPGPLRVAAAQAWFDGYMEAVKLEVERD